MQIIDAQLHELRPRRHWDGADESTRDGVLSEVVLGWMDATGVDAALLFPGEAAWGRAVLAEYPDRFAGVFPRWKASRVGAIRRDSFRYRRADF